MIASLPSVRSALLSSQHQLEELLELALTLRPKTQMRVMFGLRTALLMVKNALTNLDGLDAELPASVTGPSQTNPTSS